MGIDVDTAPVVGIEEKFGAAGACVVSTHAGEDREVRFLPLAAPAGGGGS